MPANYNEWSCFTRRTDQQCRDVEGETSFTRGSESDIPFVTSTVSRLAYTVFDSTRDIGQKMSAILTFFQLDFPPIEFHTKSRVSILT